MNIDISWYKNGISTFTLTTIEQLSGLSSIVSAKKGGVLPSDNFRGKTINLGGNIDMSTIGNNWLPIGTREQPFEGTFDGKGCKLFGLSTNSHVECMGIFGATSTFATIQNLTVDASFVEAKMIGGIVVVNAGNIQKCKFCGYIQGYSSCGGIAATSTGILNQVANKGTIIAKQKYCGGIVGVNQNDVGEIVNSYNFGKIMGIFHVGGIAGYNKGIEIKNCFNKGIVTVIEGYINAECIGGIVGYNAPGCPIKNCYNGADITCGNMGGGIVGHNNGIIEVCANSGNITGTSKIGGIVGLNSNGRMETDKNKGTVTGKSCIGGIVGENSTGTIKNCTNDSRGQISAENGQAGGIVGNSRWGRLESCDNNGVIRATDGDNVGGIVGEITFGAINSCSNTGAVWGTKNVGGIVGISTERSAIENCSNHADVQANTVVGGIGGYIYGDLKDSYNTCNVYGMPSELDKVGLIVGQSVSGSVQYCWSSGKIIGIQ